VSSSSPVSEDAQAPRHLVSSALNVLQGLRILCAAEGPVGLAEMRAALGVSEPTTFRVLQTLIHAGFARTALGGGYEPTLEVVRLGGLVTRRDHVLDATRAMFGPISRRFEEPITVGVPDGDHILFVEKLAGPRDPNFFCDIGERLPLHVGAAARCMLAYASEEAFEHYLEHSLGKRTPSTHTSRDRLREDRATTRANGFTVSVDEVDVGISAIGVPILNGHGGILAAAAIANVTARWSPDNIALRAKELCDAAASVMARVVDLPARGI
jgi:DNA-binding IclR family transcriptional regulator